MNINNEKQRLIGKRLADMRKHKGWSQSSLAQKLDELIGQGAASGKGMALAGVNGKQTVSQLERGSRGITIDIACAYADIFSVSVDYVLCRADNWQPEYAAAQELTGLSDEALAVLREYKENADIFAAYEQDPDPIKLYKQYGGESSQRLMRGRMAVGCLKALNSLLEREPEQGLLYSMFCYIFGRFSRKENAPYPENASDYQKELLNTNIEVADKATGRDALIPYGLLNNMFLAQVQSGLTRLKDEVGE